MTLQHQCCRSYSSTCAYRVNSFCFLSSHLVPQAKHSAAVWVLLGPALHSEVEQMKIWRHSRFIWTLVHICGTCAPGDIRSTNYQLQTQSGFLVCISRRLISKSDKRNTNQLSYPSACTPLPVSFSFVPLHVRLPAVVTNVHVVAHHLYLLCTLTVSSVNRVKAGDRATVSALGFAIKPNMEILQ